MALNITSEAFKISELDQLKVSEDIADEASTLLGERYGPDVYTTQCFFDNCAWA
jgi:hypothetical protein